MLRFELPFNTATPDYVIIIDCSVQLLKLTMALTQAQKQEIMQQYQMHETDTGSTELQIAFLTYRINQLTQHLKENKNDHSSRLGLLKMIGRRRRLLAYLNQKSSERYQDLIKRLGLRR